jgi:nucleobase transporter 1/2
MQGSLILAGGIHMLIGLTGFVGVLLKVVGPLTVVPTLLLLLVIVLSVVRFTASGYLFNIFKLLLSFFLIYRF